MPPYEVRGALPTLTGAQPEVLACAARPSIYFSSPTLLPGRAYTVPADACLPARVRVRSHCHNDGSCGRGAGRIAGGVSRAKLLRDPETRIRFWTTKIKRISAATPCATFSIDSQTERMFAGTE